MEDSRRGVNRVVHKNKAIHKAEVMNILIAVTVILTLLVNFIYNFYLFLTESNTSNQYLLKTFSKELESELCGTQSLMNNMIVQYADRLLDNNADNRYFVKNEIMDRMNIITPTMKHIDGTFYVSRKDGAILFTVNPVYQYNIPKELKEYIRDGKFEEKNYGQWKLICIKNNWYLIYGNIYHNIFYGSWCSIERMIKEMSESIPPKIKISILDHDQKNLIYSEDKNLLLTNYTSNIVKTKMPVLDGKSTFYIEATSFSMIQKFSQFSLFLIILCICSILILLKYVFWIKKEMVQPIGNILEAFDKVKKGKLDTRLQIISPEEFKEIGASFNEMVQEISRLKIEQYTEKIDKQKIQLQYYQMQLHPHFYLNTINTIYSMAQLGECEAIKEISVYLSKYIRYIFSKKDAYETVEEALDNLQNYLKIQKIRDGREINCYVDISSDMLEYKIPFLLLHTFVENSVKYATKPGEDVLVIKITAKIINSEIIEFLIKDNGNGYPCDMLEDVKRGDYWIKENKHIGIINVYQRMKLLYHQETTLELWNDEGACTQIKMPIQKYISQTER